jgi:hypothetical protein
MEKRFTASLMSAIGLHAALIGCAAFALSHSFHGSLPAPVRAAPQVSAEISVVVEGFDAPESASALGEAHAPSSAALARVGSTARFRAPSSTGDGVPAGESAEGSGTEAAPAGEGETPSAAPQPKINLGLDGSIFNSAVVEGARRPPAPRSRVVHDDWSAVAVRVAADQAAPREGSALLTLEWDAEGRLQSVVTSAHSSDPSLWGKLTDSLRKSLSQRPKRTPEGRGLRVVYLVRSEIIQPHHQRSVLPRIENGAFERVPSFKDLPPGAALMFGMKADTSSPGERVISVTLANSQLL